MSNNTKLICLFLKAQKTDKSSEQGYSMAMVSIITIILFSLMVAATILSNMAKARTNAFVDSNSAFYVAEAGLNKRAAEINKILKNNIGVKTNGTEVSGIGECFQYGISAGGSGVRARSATSDLDCVNYRFQSSNNIARSISGGDIVSDSGGQDNNTYVAYTLVAQNRSNFVGGQPPYAVIPAGDPFAGLNATSFIYDVSSVGKKPVALPTTDGAATATAAKDSSNNVTLSMTFVNRVVPLFQFGIFYNGDLELNATSNMQINGWVHSNANMYLQPAAANGTNPTTTFMANVSAFGSIYNRVDAWTNSPDNVTNPTATTGISRLLLSTTPTNVYQSIPAYDASVTAPLSAAQLLPFGGALKDGVAGATRLTMPPTTFGRKRNYLDNTIAESFAKADMRLEMVPDRDIVATGGTTTNMGGKAATPWTRNPAIIPFNFTAIRTGGTGTCTTAKPSTGSDPVATYVDPERENFSALRCNVFTKGQLQSLRQPVMVLTNINQTRANGTTTTAQFRTQETATLGGNPVPLPTRLNTINGYSTATKTTIVRALQVAVASTPAPIPLNILNNPFNGPTYGAATPNLATFRARFNNLINPSGTPIAGLNGTDVGNLINSSPSEIAALMQAWFLPAPIQRIETNAPTAANTRSSGFYDGREQRWITMLQTNIASLAVWNRDGIYVDDSSIGSTVKTAYNPVPTDITTAFNNAVAAIPTSTGPNLANGLAFDRVTTFTNAGAEIYSPTTSTVYDNTATPPTTSTVQSYSLQYLGLGARDTTEGGLVLHATVNDDLNDDGTIDANDINFDNTKPINVTNASGATIVADYLRTYPNQTASSQSPFAFAFSGGNYLPGAMTLYSDQSIYVQGNYNSNAANQNNTPNALTAADPGRLPAAILADTITVLSNQCVNNNGQLNCGVPPNNTPLYNNVASALSINAAFLSNTQVSNGNLGKYDNTKPYTYSGGANNYIRLLEDWFNGGNPYALNYYGSLVSLNQPVEYSGPYRAGGIGPATALPSYYNVPFRNVNFDINFQNNTLLPPLTPKASYIRQSSFSRTY
jgi:Tfp pilus assembly protein PilX